MNTAARNGKIYATRFEYRLSSLVPQLENGHVQVGRNNNFAEYSECKSQLNVLKGLPKQQKARQVNVDTKESLADWGLVACVFISNVISASDFTGFGVFYPYLVEQFDASTAAVGWCSSANGVFQAVVGKLTLFLC